MRNPFRREKRTNAIMMIYLGERQYRVPLPDAWTAYDFEEYAQEAFDNDHPALYIPSKGDGLIVLPRVDYTRATFVVWGPEA